MFNLSDGIMQSIILYITVQNSAPPNFACLDFAILQKWRKLWKNETKVCKVLTNLNISSS